MLATDGMVRFDFRDGSHNPTIPLRIWKRKAKSSEMLKAVSKKMQMSFVVFPNAKTIFSFHRRYGDFFYNACDLFLEICFPTKFGKFRMSFVKLRMLWINSKCYDLTHELETPFKTWGCYDLNPMLRFKATPCTHQKPSLKKPLSLPLFQKSPGSINTQP